MCIGYFVDSTTRVGAPKNGRQDISVYKNGVRSLYNASVENVDNFLKADAGLKKSVSLGALTTLVAGFGGAWLSMAEKLTKKTKIGAGIAIGLAALASWLPTVLANKKCNHAFENIKNDSNAAATNAEKA